MKADQPAQAKVYAYESHSNGVVDTLEDMKDKAGEQLNNARREESNAQHAFNMIQQSLTTEVQHLEKEITEDQAAKGAAGQKKGDAESALVETQSIKASDEEFLTSLTNECKNKAIEWEERQKSAAGEMAALQQGLEILQQKFADSLMQTFSSGDAD